MAKVKCSLTFIAFGFLAVAHFALAEQSVDTEFSQFEKEQQKMLADFKQSRKKSVDDFSKTKEDYIKKQNEVRATLLKKWATPELSSANVWIEYSTNNDVKRSVDYETGKITIEILSDGIKNSNVDEIVNNELALLKNETTSDAFSKDRVVNDVQTPTINAPQKMLPNVNVVALKKTAKRSQTRQKNGLYITKVAMYSPKSKISQKSKVYLPKVLKQSKKWDVDPSLILAIMHTESHFNPMAQSHIPAYGLMQIVPTSAGRDVTKFLYGKQRLLPAHKLFEPNFNIEIGSAYLNILEYKYLKGVRDPQIRTYLAIAAYNGGIGAVAKHFTRTTSLANLARTVNKQTPDFVYRSLSQKFPAKETRNYVVKVSKKQTYYRNLLKATN